MNTITVELLDWHDAALRATPLRERVFVIEQGVPADMELDAFDAASCHALATSASGDVIGTGRLLPDGHIGRMAVDAAWRCRGVGGQMLEALVAEGFRRGMGTLVLNAQVGAIDFYRRHGFAAEGDVFMEAGIAHQTMRRSYSGG